MPLFVDFETVSPVDLRTAGSRNYVTQCRVIAEGRLQVGEELPVVAHNWYGFDRLVWRHIGRPLPAAAEDTLVMARRAGYRQAGLDVMTGGGKDQLGNRLVKLLNKEAQSPQLRMPWEDKEEQRIIDTYCGRDVDLLVPLYDRLKAESTVPAWEDDVLAVDVAMNDRGILFDTELATRILRDEEEAAAKARGKRSATSLRSNKQFLLELRRWGVFAPNAQRKTLVDLLQDLNPDDEAAQLIKARLANTTITAAKIRRALQWKSPDDRLRDNLAYHRAHTGRWAGRGPQLHNLKRGHAIRGTLCAPLGMVLAVADLSQIEARVLAWLAGDHEALAAFATGDPYRAIAARMFGCRVDEVTKEQRQLGKILTLACGYGMGAEKFALTAEAWGVDLQATGFDPVQAVQLFRDSRRPTVRFWYDVERAFRNGCGRVGRVEVDGDSIILPSGRRIRYRDVHRGDELRVGPQKTYGGKLVENITQAVARDVMAVAMVAAERAGLSVVLTVHDELVVQTYRDGAAELLRIMTTTPEWAEGLPIAADSHVGERYEK